jgi:ABC-type lipoprotein export system ATPase subunit
MASGAPGDGRGAATGTDVRLTVKGLRSALAGPFDLEVRAGACAAISGASGSGKSLFLRMIADLDPHEGEAWVDDRRQAQTPGPVWRRLATYVPAESGWWRDYAHEHVAAEHREDFHAIAARLRLRPDELERPVDQLSTGEQKRCALARAFVLRSPVFLLDEPTAPLDPVGAAAVEAELKRLMAEGASIVLVTHDPEQGRRLGAASYLMADRRLGPSP